jgi:hypothetical protein
MFGWLSSFGVPTRARHPVTTRWLSLAPVTLCEGLGQLGGVLYLSTPLCVDCAVVPAADGCLVEASDLAPLLITRWVGLTCAITAEGPREWIDCVGATGETVARVYLLPDTDYLAWDGLFAGAVPVDAPLRRAPDREWLRASRARVLTFACRRMTGFTVLGARDARISTLGHGVARDIALSESVGIAG